MRTDLQRLKRDTDSHSSPSATITNAQANFERKRGYVATAILAAILVAAAAVGLWHWRAKSTSPQITSIAVLPFVNATSDANNECLSDGLTESLIGTLSQLPNVRVGPAAPSSASKEKKTTRARLARHSRLAPLSWDASHGDELGVDADPSRPTKKPRPSKAGTGHCRESRRSQ
jgi:hypothetical protein